MRVLLRIVAFLAVSVGVLGVIAPDRLIALGTMLITPTGVYVITAVRLLVGLAFLIVASSSRMPRTLRVLGVVVMIAGILTPFFGVDRSVAYVHWWSAQGPMLVRLPAIFLAVFGGFIIYAMAPARRVADGEY